MQLDQQLKSSLNSQKLSQLIAQFRAADVDDSQGLDEDVRPTRVYTHNTHTPKHLRTHIYSLSYGQCTVYGLTNPRCARL